MAGLEALSVPSERAETAEPGGVEPESESMSVDLYQHPAVYAALRAPDPALLAGVRRLIAEHLTPADVAAAAGRVVVRTMNAITIHGGNGYASRSGHARAGGNGAAFWPAGCRVPGVVDHQVRFEFEAVPAAACQVADGAPDGGSGRAGGVSIMDPACGPANWLEPFAREGWRVAGNDLSPHMVAGAQRTLAAIARERGVAEEAVGEIIWGDMRDLRFKTGPFDVALEIAGTTGLLAEPDDLLAHLTTVGEHLRVGGLFLVTVFFDRRGDRKGEDLQLPALCHDTGLIPVRLEDGREGGARARYELIGWGDDPPTMRMRRTVTTSGVPDCPPRFTEEYGLRIWPEAQVLALIERTGLYEIVSMEGLPESGGDDPFGEQTLVLRRI